MANGAGASDSLSSSVMQAPLGPVTFVIDREPVDLMLVAFLKTHTGKAVDLSRAPTDSKQPKTDAQSVSAVPYIIVYPVYGGMFQGPPLAAYLSMARFEYHVTSIGIRGDQAQWMADRVRHALFDCTAWGAYLNDMVIDQTAYPGLYVVGRDCGPPAGAVPAGKVYSVRDSYFLEVNLG